MSISETISKLIEAKHKVSEWEKRHEKYRKMIEEHMTKNDINTIDHTSEDSDYILKKIKMSRETLSKKDVPTDVWTKYSKKTHYNMIRLDKKK